MISAGERKGRTIGLKYTVHLLLPHNKVHNMAAKTKKRIGLIITNSQNMYIYDISLFLLYLTPFEHIYLSFPVF